MFADVLQSLLHDSQDGGLLSGVERIARSLQISLNGRAGQCAHALHGVHDRAVQTQLVEQRRAQLADECPDLTQLASQDLAQEAQLAGGHPHVLVEDPLDVLDLKDGVGQSLSRTVVDLLSQARALGLLGLDDAHLQIGGQAGSGDLGEQAGVATLQEEPGVLHAPNRKLELRKLLLVATQIRRQAFDVRPESLLAGIFGACLRGGGRIGLVCGADRGAVGCLALVAQVIPATQSVVVSLAVSLGD
jgi:hypothetical protein